MATSATTWKPGQSGNPSGRPKVIAEVQELAREATPMAIAALKRICADHKAPAAAQVSAAIALLDRGWGRPHQSVELGIHRASIDELSDAELIAIVNGSGEQKLITSDN